MSEALRAASQSQETDVVLANLIAELTDKLQAGEVVDIAELLARHPERAEELRRLLPALQWVDELKVLPDSAASEEKTAGEGVAGTLGDFRIIREVGRGGMGIVYEAEQLSLHRRVALKVLPFAGTLDPKQLQRFKHEAQAAAQLHHTNIVPVHFVGCERGVHFYAMQYIDGRTLAEIIRQLRQPAAEASGGRQPAEGHEQTTAYAPPSGAAAAGPATEPAGRQPTLATGSAASGREHFRWVARLGVQAAEALDHAHQAGVVHRDVKPANLMLDVRGNLWVTDFGLAHVQSEASLTMSGDLVGTLRYMSPEQALAKRVVIDHRTDVYSLGVTLYELLTLRPACAGKDRQELLRQIAFDEPKTPRRLNKAIPAELETIVLKAMTKNPQERYATAQELADDLRHFLEDKPIRARRPTWGQRMVRWSRRHKALVQSAVVVLLLAVVGLTVSTVMIARAQKRTEAALEAEEEQRLIADSVVEFLANDLLGSAAPENMLGRKVTVEEVLANAEQKIAGAFVGEPRVKAAISTMMGRTYMKLGLYPEAERHFQVARTLHARWIGSDAPETLCSMHNLALVLRQQGKLEEARQLNEELLGQRRKVLGEDHPATLAVVGNLAEVLRHQGKLEEAQQLNEELLERERKVLRDAHPLTLSTMNNLACVLSDQGKWLEARSLHEEVLALRRRVLREEHPDTLASMYNLADVAQGLGQLEEARRRFDEVLVRMRRLQGDRHPDTLETMNSLAFLLAACEDPKICDSARAVELATKATTLAPQAGTYWNTLGVARYRAGDWKGTIEALHKSMELTKGGSGADWFFLAMAQWQLGDRQQACKLFGQGVTWMDKNKPEDKELRRFRAEAAQLLGIKDSLPEKARPAGKK
jgi:serine/threonine protein kinase